MGRFIILLAQGGEEVTEPETGDFSPDPNDDPFYHCALGGDADYIITDNVRDLPPVRNRKRPRIIYPFRSVLWTPLESDALLMGVLGAVALLLAAMGIYGVISYLVAQRTREMGIRLALGAQRHDLLKLVLGQGVRLTMIGVAAGLTLALALTRFLSSMLYGVSAADPITFASIALLFAGVALTASYLPARRAMKVDPITGLRHE